MNAKSTHARNLLTQYTHQNEYNCYVNKLEFFFHSNFAISCQYIYITIKICCFVFLFFFTLFAAINKYIFHRHLLSMQEKNKHIILRLYKQFKICNNILVYYTRKYTVKSVLNNFNYR